MKQYVDGLLSIIKDGRRVEDRTGTGAISLFGDVQSIYYMKDGFPLLGLKYSWWKGVYHELLWFLDAVPEEYKKFGNTNIKYLVDNEVGIWNEWPYEKYKKYANSLEEPDYEVHIDSPNEDRIRIMTLNEFVEQIKKSDTFAMKWGGLGPVYGKQWTNWSGDGEKGNNYIEGLNQIKTCIRKLFENPDDRGNIVSAWNVVDLPAMALRPCHTMFQLKSEPLTREERKQIFKERAHELNLENLTDLAENMTDEELDSEKFNIPKRRLSLKMYQRSMDSFLGQPFNVASYACLLHMIAHVTNQVPYKFIHTVGDAHIYSNHYEQVNKLLSRTNGVNSEIKDFVNNPTECHNMIGEDMGHELPSLSINPRVKKIEDFRFDDIKINNYKHYGSIKAPVAV